MMTFKRKAYERLQAWMNEPKRKPLIIRGARQVGKTTLVNHFGQEYDQFIALNLEKERHRSLFETIPEVENLIAAIFLQFNRCRDGGRTLLFIDEIQESPKALQMLRYFHEETPDVDIIAAGSLLEFALDEVRSFPVGRVEQLALHPLNFEEFLGAIGETRALEALQTIPFPNHAFDRLHQLFLTYARIGGMPEIVADFAEHRDLTRLPRLFDALWQSFKDDVEKYAKGRTELNIIRHIIDTAPYAEKRITFGGFGQSNYKSREVGEAFRTLDRTRLIRLIYPTTNTKPPLVPNLTRKPRLQFLDTGLLNHAMGIQADLIALSDLADVPRGHTLEHIVFQELEAEHDSVAFKPAFWVRDKANSIAEVDLVFQKGKHLIPVEVKSGKAGKLKSLHQFMLQCDHDLGLRLLANHYSVEAAKINSERSFRLVNLPYFLASKVPAYARLQNYSS